MPSARCAAWRISRARKETLRALTATLFRRGGPQLAEQARQGTRKLETENWLAKRKSLVSQISAKAQRAPIDPDWLALQVVNALPPDAILVDEGLTSSRYIPFLRANRSRYDYHALASGGIGWGLPASVGVGLANPGRPVVCYTGDGSAMYSIQALWTAAHHKLPLNVVLVNNGGYRIIKQRLRAFHNDERFIGMDFVDPPVDFAAVARGLGLEAMRIDASEDLDGLADAFRNPAPKLIEVVVDRAL